MGELRYVNSRKRIFALYGRKSYEKPCITLILNTISTNSLNKASENINQPIEPSLNNKTPKTNGKGNLYVTIAFAILFIVIKGYSGDGQGTILSPFINAYIEETSASIAKIYDNSFQVATIDSMVDPSIGILGQGGQQLSLVEPETSQGNAFIATNPVDTNYIDSVSEKRSEVIEYTVQTGDALSFIASDYGVSTSSIIWANNLKSADSIYPGQILRIPPVSGVIHKVAKGDTIVSIASKYGVSETEVSDFNNLKPETKIQIGDEIIVPGGKVGQKTTVASTQQRFSHLPNLSDFFMAPTSGYNWGIIHGRNGIDIANSCGTPIYSAAEGKVSATYDVGWNGGFGKYIKITHSNETETLYAHLSKIIVSEGDSVSKGELIGLMGTTGRSTGCHLHFEVHGAKNPMAK